MKFLTRYQVLLLSAIMLSQTLNAGEFSGSAQAGGKLMTALDAAIAQYPANKPFDSSFSAADFGKLKYILDTARSLKPPVKNGFTEKQWVKIRHDIMEKAGVNVDGDLPIGNIHAPDTFIGELSYVTEAIPNVVVDFNEIFQPVSLNNVAVALQKNDFRSMLSTKGLDNLAQLVAQRLCMQLIVPDPDTLQQALEALNSLMNFNRNGMYTGIKDASAKGAVAFLKQYQTFLTAGGLGMAYPRAVADAYQLLNAGSARAAGNTTQLGKQLQDCDDEIKKLKEQIKDLEGQLEGCNTGAKMDLELKDMNQKELQGQFDKVLAELQRVQRDLKDTETLRDRSTQSWDKTREALQDAQQQIADLKDQNRQLGKNMDTIKAMQEERKRLEQQLKECQEGKVKGDANTQAAYQSLEKNMQALAQELDKAKQDLASQTATGKDSKDLNARLSADLAQLRQSHDNLSRDKDAINTALDQATQQVAQLKQELADCAAGKMMGDDEAQAAHKKLQEELQATKAQLNKMKQDLDFRANNAQQLADRNTQLQADYTALNKRFDDLSTSFTLNEASIEQKTAKITELTQQLADCQKATDEQNRKALAQAAQKESELRQLRTQLANCLNNPPAGAAGSATGAAAGTADGSTGAAGGAAGQSDYEDEEEDDNARQAGAGNAQLAVTVPKKVLSVAVPDAPSMQKTAGQEFKGAVAGWGDFANVLANTNGPVKMVVPNIANPTAASATTAAIAGGTSANGPQTGLLGVLNKARDAALPFFNAAGNWMQMPAGTQLTGTCTNVACTINGTSIPKSSLTAAGTLGLGQKGTPDSLFGQSAQATDALARKVASTRYDYTQCTSLAQACKANPFVPLTINMAAACVIAGGQNIPGSNGQVVTLLQPGDMGSMRQDTTVQQLNALADLCQGVDGTTATNILQIMRSQQLPALTGGTDSPLNNALVPATNNMALATMNNHDLQQLTALAGLTFRAAAQGKFLNITRLGSAYYIFSSDKATNTTSLPALQDSGNYIQMSQDAFERLAKINKPLLGAAQNAQNNTRMMNNVPTGLRNTSGVLGFATRSLFSQLIQSSPV